MKQASLVLLGCGFTSCVAVHNDFEALRLELSDLERSSTDDFGSDSGAQDLGAATLVIAGDDPHMRGEVGLKFGTFELEVPDADGDDEATYFEFSIGARFYPFPLREEFPLQPYLALGAFWCGGSWDERDDHRHDDGKHAYDDPYYDDYDLWSWIWRNAGFYGTLALDVAAGPFSVSAGVRALLGDDVDVFARHDDGFALETFLAAGVSF